MKLFTSCFIRLSSFPVLFILLLTFQAQSQDLKFKAPDPAKDKILYTVGYAHLDTQWRWDYVETINEYIKATLDENFKRFEKYPGYVFNFTGSRRYRYMKEYYPEKYEKLKKYIADGRWFVSGSSVDECDANITSPESVIRHVLYGNNFFRKEFNKESVDFMLPDCFGFQAHIPSVLAHCGIKGFSTQKLVWGSAVGIPFNEGMWTGPDGKGVVAALNATDYGGSIEKRLDTVAAWDKRIDDNVKKYGLNSTYRYYGTGDVGGAPEEKDIKNALESIGNPDSKFKVYLCSSDQMFRDIPGTEYKNLPKYSGDLLLTEHSSGSLTSQAYMKRWNRKNEQLGLATEPLAVFAEWLGGPAYPMDRINKTWELVLGSQMHDILPGTCLPKAYEYAWNDEVLSLNQFASEMQDAVSSIAAGMDTRAEGKSIVVYNPVATAREDVIEAEVFFPEGRPDNVRVFGPSGTEVPSQLLEKKATSLRILFLAKIPSLGLVSFDVKPTLKAYEGPVSVNVKDNILDNDLLEVTVNKNGDIAAIFDKKTGREVLARAARLEFLRDHPRYWPAWNMDWKDRKNPPIGYVDGPARITIEESGPVRVSLRVERKARNSVFVQHIRLSTGEAGRRIEVANEVQWQSAGVCLKASFPLNGGNRMATYNLGLGTIERETNTEKKFEVPSREWIDLTDKSGKYGLSILEDCKYGSDKPNDSTIRLTLLRTPLANFYHDQATQDWGTHEFTYCIYPHQGDWRQAGTNWQGRFVNQPLRGFQTLSHPGRLGRTIYLLSLNTNQAEIRVVKKAENSSKTIIRIQELEGKEAKHIELSGLAGLLSAEEVDGQERRIGDAGLSDGKLIFDLGKYEIKTFAVELQKSQVKLAESKFSPIVLDYDQDVVSSDGEKHSGRFDDKNISIPAELFPEQMTVDGVPFSFGPKEGKKGNVISCKRQKVNLPQGNYTRLYLLASATEDIAGIFRIGGKAVELGIQEYTGKIGQFDNRVWDASGNVTDLKKGFIKRGEVAWFTQHTHQDGRNIPYQYAYIYKYALDLPKGINAIQLPDNEKIKIFAMTAGQNSNDEVSPVMPLYDDFTGRQALVLDPGKQYVTKDTKPMARLVFDRKKDDTKLRTRLSSVDYADVHSNHGVSVKYYFSRSNESFPGKQLAQGMEVAGLTDGSFFLSKTDSANDLWFPEGEGRFVIDLKKTIHIDSINIYAVQDVFRGPQVFTLWMFPGDNAPVPDGDPKKQGWQYLLSVPAQEMWGNGRALYSILPDKVAIKGRYLMWITQEFGHGPEYFREVDVYGQ